VTGADTLPYWALASKGGWAVKRHDRGGKIASSIYRVFQSLMLHPFVSLAQSAWMERKPRKFQCLFSRCDILAKTILHAGTTSSSLLSNISLVDFGTCSGSPFDISSIKYLSAVCPVVERSTVLSRLQSHSKRATESQRTQVVKDGKFTLLHLRLVETVSPLPQHVEARSRTPPTCLLLQYQ
jgi:hypothetical protein